MRYILSLALLMSACTRANPDATGGNGGSGGGGTAGAGGGGGGAGGGGGGAGGGGMGGGHDMSMSMIPDMSHAVSDMAAFVGTTCGNLICSGSSPDCCVNNTGDHCVNGSSTGCTNGPLFMCDGPEDCIGQFAGDICCLQFTNSGPGGTKLAGSGCELSCGAPEDQLCHSDTDCVDNLTNPHCCPLPNSSYHHCAATACP